jgi:hypothetical protein
VISWISLLQHFRLFQSFQFILTLLRASLKDMGVFFIVMFLINQGFMLGYLRTLTNCWNWMEGETCQQSEISDLELLI